MTAIPKMLRICEEHFAMRHRFMQRVNEHLCDPKLRAAVEADLGPTIDVESYLHVNANDIYDILNAGSARTRDWLISH